MNRLIHSIHLNNTLRSQVSLTPSDLTTSDPDLTSVRGGSTPSLAFSRPSSSSSGIASPDSAAHPVTDIVDAGEEWIDKTSNRDFMVSKSGLHANFLSTMPPFRSTMCADYRAVLIIELQCVSFATLASLTS